MIVCGSTEYSEDLFIAFLVDISPTGGFNGYARWQDEFPTEFHGIAPFPGTGVLLAGAGTSANSGSWVPETEYLTDRAGTWTTSTGVLESPSGVMASPTTSSVIVTNGVEDTGDGYNYYYECALISSGLP
jgi:hypothetical protein